MYQIPEWLIGVSLGCKILGGVGIAVVIVDSLVQDGIRLIF